MKCKNHLDTDAIGRCTGCQEAFCGNCLVEVDEKRYCGECKVMAVRETPVIIDEENKESCEEAKLALRFALIGVFCLGFIMGPIAMIKATKARERFKEEPNLTGEGFAMAALITGMTESIFWFIGFFVKLSNGM